MKNYLRPFAILALVAVSATTDSATKASDAAARRAPIESFPGVQSHVFYEAGDVTLKLHVFNPPGHQATDRRPAVVFFFGGGWRHGEPAQFVGHAQYFAARGMVAICPEYRTSQKHGTTPRECVADGKAALRWIRKHAAELGVDPARIAAGGGSAGGHVAASTAVLNDLEATDADRGTSCVPDALVLFNPVVDTTATGYGSERLKEASRDLSPVHHLRAKLPPTLLFHGRSDKTVPFENASRFAAEMKQLGNDCRLVPTDRAGHGFYWDEPHYSATLAAADALFVELGWLAANATNTKPESKSLGFQRHDAFVAGEDGYHTYRIPSLVVSTKGTLLLFCDGRVNSASDHGKMDLVLRRSADGGRTWQPLQVLFDDPQGEAKIGNVSAVVDRQSGAIHAVFCKNLVQAFVRTSTDDGVTWSPAVDITAAFREFPFAWKFFATGHAHGIQLKSGRLLVPVFMSSVDRFGAEAKEKKTDFRVGTLTSDDHGRSWHAGGLVPDDVLINESTLFETEGGGVVVNCRSVRRSVRVQSRSTDGGSTWSKIEGSAELRGPACQGSSLVTVDPAGKRVVVFTHVTEKNRSNLVAHLSYDDGRTWPLMKVIEPGRAAYGDLAAGDDSAIYLGYERGGSKTISVARFNVAWLLDGAQPTGIAPNAPPKPAGNAAGPVK